VAMVAFPFIAGGIFFIQSWFRERRSRGKMQHIEF